jgi:hypothetical protein
MTRSLAFLTAGLLTLAVSGCRAAGPARPAPEQIEGLARQSAEDAAEVERLNGQIDVLEAANGGTAAAGPALGRSDAQPRTQAEQQWRVVQSELSKFFESSCTQLAERVTALRDEWQDRCKHLLDDWKVLGANRWVKEAQLYAQNEDRALASQTAYLMSSESRAFWLLNLLAVAALAVAAWHDRRHDVRRVLNGGRAQSLGLSKFLGAAVVAAAALMVLVIAFGDGVYRRVTARATRQAQPPWEELQGRAESLKAEKAQRQAEYEQKGGPGGAPSGPWAKARRAAVDLAGLARARKYVDEQLQADAQHVLRLDAELGRLRAEASGFRGSRQLFQAGLGTALCAAAGAGGYALVAQRRRRRRRVADTCPMCLTAGKLKGERRSTRGAVRCAAEGCEFDFPAVYRPLTKLCFPTLGHGYSGKTHWLAMTYRELSEGRYDDAVRFEAIQSGMSGDFDRIIGEILDQRADTAATQAGDHLRKPLMFNFRDADPFGPSNLLVNVFDLPGVVTAGEQYGLLTSALRRRALDSDGYLFFLDPTLPSHVQSKALQRFQTDLRALRGVAIGEQIRAPVALIMSKIDLIVNEKYAKVGGPRNPAYRFLEELCAIDPTGRVMTLDVLRRRSELTAKLRPTVWPSWEIERQIGDLFGGRVMFFPETPVGLNEPGVTDLRHRVIEPFAILAPLMWLIHMNGYPVLK